MKNLFSENTILFENILSTTLKKNNRNITNVDYNFVNSESSMTSDMF